MVCCRLRQQTSKVQQCFNKSENLHQGQWCMLVSAVIPYWLFPLLGFPTATSPLQSIPNNSHKRRLLKLMWGRRSAYPFLVPFPPFLFFPPSFLTLPFSHTFLSFFTLPHLSEGPYLMNQARVLGQHCKLTQWFVHCELKIIIVALKRCGGKH